MCCFIAHLQQFLSCGPLLWILGQGQFDKMVEVVRPVVQQREKDKTRENEKGQIFRPRNIEMVDLNSRVLHLK